MMCLLPYCFHVSWIPALAMRVSYPTISIVYHNPVKCLRSAFIPSMGGRQFGNSIVSIWTLNNLYISHSFIKYAKKQQTAPQRNSCVQYVTSFCFFVVMYSVQALASFPPATACRVGSIHSLWKLEVSFTPHLCHSTVHERLNYWG